MQKNEKIILGIDPGLATTGFGIVQQVGDDYTVIDYGCITTQPDMAFADRLSTIYDDLNQVIEMYKPVQCCIEELFFCNNAKTAFLVGQARGVMMLTLLQQGIEISEFTPLQVKRAITGYGKADKKQMQTMVMHLLSLKSIPKPDDAADALALALCGGITLYNRYV